MARKKWIVVVDWKSGTYEDSHDFTVFAESISAARAKARARWIGEFQKTNPDCVISKIWILTPEAISRLA